MRDSWTRWWKVLFLASVLMLAPFSSRGAFDPSKELVRLKEFLQSPNINVRIEGLRGVASSFYTDKELFDWIEKTLLAVYRVDPESGMRVDEASWLCKALAASGEPGYKKTLAVVSERAPSSKIRKYAVESLERLAQNERRNAVMAKQTEETLGLSPLSAGLVNLLRSSNLRDKNEAAEFITNSDIRDEKVFEVVNKELLLGVREFSADDQHARTMHWLCMALSASGNPRFRATLETVSAEARDKGLRSAAKENADILR